MFYLTPPALIWLVVHKLRHPAGTRLPDGLLLLLIVVALCWLIAIVVIIGNSDRPYG